MYKIWKPVDLRDGIEFTWYVATIADSHRFGSWQLNFVCSSVVVLSMRVLYVFNTVGHNQRVGCLMWLYIWNSTKMELCIHSDNVWVYGEMEWFQCKKCNKLKCRTWTARWWRNRCSHFYPFFRLDYGFVWMSLDWCNSATKQIHCYWCCAAVAVCTYIFTHFTESWLPIHAHFAIIFQTFTCDSWWILCSVLQLKDDYESIKYNDAHTSTL